MAPDGSQGEKARQGLCVWLFGNPSWAEAALSNSQNWTFISAPKTAAKGWRGHYNHGEGQKGVKGQAVIHLSLLGARGCFWCQAVLQGCPSALPKPAERSHKVQGEQWEQPGHSGVGKGGYKGLSHQLRLQLLQGVTENLGVRVPGWPGLWGGYRQVSNKREAMEGGKECRTGQRHLLRGQ